MNIILCCILCYRLKIYEIEIDVDYPNVGGRVPLPVGNIFPGKPEEGESGYGGKFSSLYPREVVKVYLRLGVLIILLLLE